MKKSRFNNLQEFESTALLSDRNHFLTFIDYEGEHNLLPDSLIVSLLDGMRNHLVLTIAVRGSEFYLNGDLLSKYIGMMEKHDNLAFCIVAGHPAYQSIDTRKPVIEGFELFLARIRKKVSDRPVFLGAENLSSGLIARLNEKYGEIVPFFLNGDTRLVKMNGLPAPRAVYSPLAVSTGRQRATELLFSYLLRRKYTQDKLMKANLRIEYSSDLCTLPDGALEILHHCLDKFTLTDENFDRRVQQFIESDVKILVGNPAIPEARNRIIEQLNPETGRHISESGTGNKQILYH